METFLIAATTADGFIAREAAHVPFDWTSKEDKVHFAKKTKKARVVVMGKTTFSTIPKALPDRLNVVYSDIAYEDAETTTASPSDLIKQLRERGFNDIAICGGSSIYTQFMEAGVIDTLYITVEPILFGQGISLFNKPLDVQLELQSIETLNEKGTLLKTYNVKK